MDFDRSMAPAVHTSLDVAMWLLDRARADDCHLPFQKLQRLLYLAQSLFAAQTGGTLMPAVFVADEHGPIEPNLQRLLGGGRPKDALVEAPSTRVRDFLETIWQRFATMPVERLNGYVAKNAAYVAARNAGPGSVVDIAAMAEAVRATMLQPAKPIRVLRSQNGSMVTARPWTPAGAETVGTKPKP